MSMIPPTTVAGFSARPSFPYLIPPYTNGVPFTYRDGMTFLRRMEAFAKYIDKELIPWIDDGFKIYVDAFNKALDDIRVYMEGQQKIIDDKIVDFFEKTANLEAALKALVDEAKGYADDAKAAQLAAEAGAALAEQWAANTKELQDLAVTNLIGDRASQTSAALDTRIKESRTWIDVKDFGVKFDGTDSSVALKLAIEANVPLWFGGPDRVITITRPLNATLGAHANWSGMGATIQVASTGQQARSVNIDTNGYDFSATGIVIDGNRKTHMAFALTTMSDKYASIYLKEVFTKNVYRLSPDIVGGDGIYIRGKYQNIYVNSPRIKDIVMAANAGVTGSQGVAGLTISSAGAGLAPVGITVINPMIENVYCEDAAYGADQDGIRIFTEEDNPSSTSAVALFSTNFTIMGGHIKNAHGRAIKSQCEFGRVIGTQIERISGTQAPWMQGQNAYPDIDFQVGGGIVEAVEVKYHSASAATVVQGSGTRMAGGKYSTSLHVTNLKVSASGGSNALVRQIIAINMFEQRMMNVMLDNIEFVNLGSYIDGNIIQITGVYEDAEINLMVNNLAAPMQEGKYVAFRSGVATPINMAFNNIVNSRKQSRGDNQPRLQGSNNAANRTWTRTGMLVGVSE